MTFSSARLAPIKRLTASLAAIIAVTAIFGAKAYEAEQAHAAFKAETNAQIAAVDRRPAD